MAEIIMKENPNSEVCRIENYKDDIIISTKYYVDNKLIYESNDHQVPPVPMGKELDIIKEDTTEHRNMTRIYV